MFHQKNTGRFGFATGLFFWMIISSPLYAGNIHWEDNGQVGREYDGRDELGRPADVIHYQRNKYGDSYMGIVGKDVRSYNENGLLIRTRFINEQGLVERQEDINSKTGETTSTTYFDHNGNPNLKFETYTRYDVKQAAEERRHPLKNDSYDPLKDWPKDFGGAMKGWQDSVRDFFSGGSLGITKKGSKDTPAKTEPAADQAPMPNSPQGLEEVKVPEEKPSGGDWDFLPQYDFNKKPPKENENMNGGQSFGNENFELNWRKYGDTQVFDPQLGQVFIINSVTGTSTQIVHLPIGDQHTSVIMKDREGRLILQETYDRNGRLTETIETILIDPKTGIRTVMTHKKGGSTTVKLFDADGNPIEEKSSEKTTEKKTAEKKVSRADQRTKSSETQSAFTDFDRISTSPMAQLSGSTTPTAVLDGVSSRNMSVDSGTSDYAHVDKEKESY